MNFVLPDATALEVKILPFKTFRAFRHPLPRAHHRNRSRNYSAFQVAQ
jgi:hypothetical protein